jgi:DNA-binding transcriptional ArsR family regulator
MVVLFSLYIDIFIYYDVSNAMVIMKKRGSDSSNLAKFKAEFFKALAHPLRIRVIDALRKGEIGVNDLCSLLEVEQSTLSQQLALLRSRNIVVGRKEGQNVYYSIRDTAIFRLLDVAKEIFNNQLVSVQDMLSQLEVSPGRSR